MSQRSPTYGPNHRGTAATSTSQVVHDPLHLYARKQGLTAILQAALHEEGQQYQQHTNNTSSSSAADMKRYLARAVVAGAMRGSSAFYPLNSNTSTNTSSSCSCCKNTNRHNGDTSSTISSSGSCSCTSCMASSCSCSSNNNCFSANTSSCSQCMRERQHHHQQQHQFDYCGDGGGNLTSPGYSRGRNGGFEQAPSPMLSDPYQLSAPSQSSNHSSGDGVRRTMMAGLDFSLDPQEAPIDNTLTSLGSGNDGAAQFIPTGHLAGRAFIDDLDISTGGYAPPPHSHQPHTHLSESANPSNRGDKGVAMITTTTPPNQPPTSTEVPNHVLSDILHRLEALKEEQRKSKQLQPTSTMVDSVAVSVEEGGREMVQTPLPIPTSVECDTQTSFIHNPDTPPKEQPLHEDEGDAIVANQISSTPIQTDTPPTPHLATTDTHLPTQRATVALIDAEVHGRIGIVHEEEQEVLVSIVLPLMLLLIQQPLSSSSTPTPAGAMMGVDTTNPHMDNIDNNTLPVVVDENIDTTGAVVKLLSTSSPTGRGTGGGRYGGGEGSSSSSSAQNNNDEATPLGVVDHSALSDAKRMFMHLDEGNEGAVDNNDDDSIPSKVVSQAAFDLTQVLWRDMYPIANQLVSRYSSSQPPTLILYTPPVATTHRQQQLPKLHGDDDDDNDAAHQQHPQVDATLLTPLDRAALVLSSLHARITPSTPYNGDDKINMVDNKNGGIVCHRDVSSLREAIEGALFNAHGTQWLSPLLATSTTPSTAGVEDVTGLVADTKPSFPNDDDEDKSQQLMVTLMTQLFPMCEEEMSSRASISDNEGIDRCSILHQFHTSLHVIHIAESSRNQQRQMEDAREVHATEMGVIRAEMAAASEATLEGYRGDIDRLRKDLTASQIQCAGLHARLKKLLLMPNTRSPLEGATTTTTTTITASPPREKEDASLPIHERFARAHRQALTTIHQQL